MQRSEIVELQYITPLANAPSILERGILSQRRAPMLSPASVAMPEVQAIRAKKAVPAGRPLHEYVNLYFSARNPMLYKRAATHRDLCVLQVSPAVLDLPGVVVADGNAASSYTAFWTVDIGLAKVDARLVFAEFWTADDQIDRWRRMRVKCAEVLVPDRVETRFILGARVSCQEAADTLGSSGFTLPVTVDGHLFFRG